MARPYSYDLRQKAVEVVLKGAKRVEVSKLFGMSKGHSAKLTDLAGFRQFVEANPGLTQKEM